MAITLLEMLLDAGLITAGQCDEALQNRVFFGGRIGTNLIELGFVEEEDLARFLSRKLAVPYADPKELLNLQPKVVSLIPRELAVQYQVVPLREENRRLYVATADPSALNAIDEIAFITGKIVRPLITPEVRLVQALGKYYQYPIDERYQQIIDHIEERRQAAAAAARQDPPPAEPGPEPEPAARETLQEPWRGRLEHYSIDHTSRMLARAEDPGEIGDSLIHCIGQSFAQAALFLVRAKAICGWRAIREGSLREEIRQLRIPLEDAALLGSVAQKRKPYLGPLPETPLRNQLASALGGELPGKAMLVPVLVIGRTVIIIYVAGSPEQLQQGAALLKKLATKAALAFEILIAREKILMS